MKRLGLGVTFGPMVLTILGLAAAALILGTLTFSAAHEALERQLDHRIDAESHALQTLFADGGRTAIAAAIRRREDQVSDAGMDYLLVDQAGGHLAGRMIARAPAPGRLEFLRVQDYQTGRRHRSQALTVQLSDGSRLVVAADRAPIREVDRAIGRMIAAAFAVMVVIGLLCAWLLGRVIQRRLDRINAAAQAIIDGDHSRRMPRDRSGADFDRLAETLNHMLDRNAELLENLRQVSTDIAHDLRTPLSRLHQVLEEALAEGADPDAYRRAIETAAGNSREILDLFAALLRISEVESLQVRSAFQSLDLSALVERVTEAFAPDIEASGRSLVVAADPEVLIEGDRHLLSQMLVNLIENGIRHTPSGATLSVILRRSAAGARLTVADDGPGVASRDHEFVLRRFARLEQSRSTPGHGLGLSLVSAIARAHYADLSLADNLPGLIISILFAPSA